MIAATNQLLNGMSILIVEDEMLVAKALEEAFNDHGARKVRLAMLKSKARKLIAKGIFDAVVLDLRLPDGETIGIGQELSAKRIPLVIYSGHACDETDLGLPGAVFCPKPSSPERLVNSVIAACEKCKVS